MVGPAAATWPTRWRLVCDSGTVSTRLSSRLARWFTPPSSQTTAVTVYDGRRGPRSLLALGDRRRCLRTDRDARDLGRILREVDARLDRRGYGVHRRALLEHALGLVAAAQREAGQRAACGHFAVDEHGEAGAARDR